MTRTAPVVTQNVVHSLSVVARGLKTQNAADPEPAQGVRNRSDRGETESSSASEDQSSGLRRVMSMRTPGPIVAETLSFLM